MRVALKSIRGVEDVNVSLEKGEAVVTFATANAVRYQELVRAVEKNGFVVKGAKLVAAGRVNLTAGTAEFTVSGSNDRFRLQPASGGVAQIADSPGAEAQITGSVAEAPKGKTPDVLRYESVVPK